jgi:hypothetical protein
LNERGVALTIAERLNAKVIVLERLKDLWE